MPLRSAVRQTACRQDINWPLRSLNDEHTGKHMFILSTGTENVNILQYLSILQAEGKDPDQTTQTDLGLHCLQMPENNFSFGLVH